MIEMFASLQRVNQQLSDVLLIHPLGALERLGVQHDLVVWS